MSCNSHVVGMLYDGAEFLTEANLVSTFRDIAIFSRELNPAIGTDTLGNDIVDMRYLLDGRRGHVQLFRYCPCCGQRINMASARERVKCISLVKES